MDLSDYLRRRQRLVDEGLERWVPREDDFPPAVHQAMRYSLFAGGKRLRPILVLAGAEAVGGRAEDALPLACSLELIHTYSLIHDDLPAMDDDDLRRGKLTNHKVFGEAVAILAGDGLLTEAFHLLTRPDLMKNLSHGRRLRVIRLIAAAAGSAGMVGGQTMDITCEGRKIEPGLLEYIHRHKTGALIAASVAAGAIAGGGSAGEVRALRGYGEDLGLAFQIMDDLLDVKGEEGKMGKALRKDAARGKATYPALFGVAESRARAEALVEEALGLVQPFGRRAEPLRAIARYILKRTN